MFGGTKKRKEEVENRDNPNYGSLGVFLLLRCCVKGEGGRRKAGSNKKGKRRKGGMGMGGVFFA